MTSKSTYREACAKEFRWENFWFPVRNRKRFVKSQWSYIPTLVWKVWKVVIAIYFISWLGVSLDRFRVDSPKAPESKWLIFLTHWTYLFFTGYLLISAINVCLNSFCHRRHRTVTLGLWSLKLQWFLWNVGAPATVAVVLLYWSILWPNRPAPRHPHPSIMNVHVHLVNGIIILVDQAFHAMPMNYYHVYQPMLYGVAYATFTGVYYEANGTDPTGKPAIYPFLNYETHRKMALGADFGVIFIAIPVIWTVLFGLLCVRNFIWRTCDPFATESFALDNAHGKSQWRLDFWPSQYPFKIWKAFLALYFFSWLVVDLALLPGDVLTRPALKYLIFLTNWSYLVFTAYVIVSAVNVCSSSAWEPDGRLIKYDWPLKVQWVLWNVGSVSAVAVMILYWTLLGENLSALSIHKHLINGLIILVDHAVSATPVHLLHVYQPMLYGVAYALFTGIYFAADNTVDPPYKFLDFLNNTGLAVEVDFAIVFLMIPILHVFFWLTYRLRVYLAKGHTDLNTLSAPSRVAGQRPVFVFTLRDVDSENANEKTP